MSYFRRALHGDDPWANDAPDAGTFDQGKLFKGVVTGADAKGAIAMPGAGLVDAFKSVVSTLTGAPAKPTVAAPTRNLAVPVVLAGAAVVGAYFLLKKRS